MWNIINKRTTGIEPASMTILMITREYMFLQLARWYKYGSKIQTPKYLRYRTWGFAFIRGVVTNSEND